MVGMKRTGQPAMRPDPRVPRVDRVDLGPEDRSAAVRAWRSASALTRWALLVAVVAVGTAAVIAVTLAALFTLVDSSL